LIVPIRDA